MSANDLEYELTDDIAQQIKRAHRKMKRAGISLLPESSADYAKYFWSMEDANNYSPGYVDYPDRELLVYLYEAIGALCAVNHDDVLRLLDLAKKDLEPRSRGNVGNALFGDVAT